MGVFVSAPTCRQNYGVEVNCSSSQDPEIYVGGLGKREFEGNPDIAGVGIVSFFLALTSFALVVSLLDVIWYAIKLSGIKPRFTKKEKAQRNRFYSLAEILESLVLSCSDQQLFTGGAYALVLRYWKGYHYNIVANMLLLACATHLMSVTIVRNYWRYPLVAILRVALTTALVLVTGLTLVNQGAAPTPSPRFPTDVPSNDDMEGAGLLMFLPAACFQDLTSNLTDTLGNTFRDGEQFLNTVANRRPGVHGWDYYIAILLCYALSLLAEAGRYIRRGRDGQGWRANFVKRVRLSCAYVLRFPRLLRKAGTYIFQLRRWVAASEWVRLEGNRNPEDDPTTFGQLVPILLCFLTVFSFLQMLHEKALRAAESRYDGVSTIVQFKSPPSEDGIDSGCSDKKGGAVTAVVSILPTPRRLEDQIWLSESQEPPRLSPPNSLPPSSSTLARRDTAVHGVWNNTPGSHLFIQGPVQQ
ncbi:hypothetical protein GQ53DRAFT_820558 [Thozetella sp. PMI_491]|nr:hypothetical protein GQ53DRAFT_820558 [Thozetella sp. PMI_491]